jgi:GNAT superfamily N-acetyltransferase
MDLRPITPADIAACVDVYYAADEHLTAGFNLPLQPRNTSGLERMLRHISQGTPHRAWLAEDGGSVAGFGMSAEYGELVFLAVLFIRPEAQSAGLGTALYERCVPRSGYRATCIWSIQPVSAAVYARDGLVPRVPIYTLEGRLRTPLPSLPADLTLGGVSFEEMDVLDRELVGVTRRRDHDAWQSWDRRPFALRAGSDLLGYGYAQPAGRIGPVIVRDPEHLLPFVGALMERVDVVDGWMIHVPGPAAATFAGLLRAGLRFDGAPTIFCATDGRIDHSRYLPGSLALP